MNPVIASLKSTASIVILSGMLALSAPAWAEEDLWEEEAAWEEAGEPVEQPISDPLEWMNRGIYSFNKFFDDYLLSPVARGYGWITPQPVKQGISNFYDNLTYPVVIVNGALQGKFSQSGSDVSRLLINSTAGLLGFFDMATRMDINEHHADLGQTFGKWGLGSGPYLVIPFLGPSGVRDGVGLVGDFFLDPITYIDHNRTRYSFRAVEIVDKRYRFLEASDILEETAIDPYAYVRSAYLQSREQAIAE
ncbi:MAG: VacJ family lipoprotein [Gammaproteobacteria bacterium]|nr:MAG: VacJ family lipoprotein [Gammaproteobacteria bacterium]